MLPHWSLAPELQSAALIVVQAQEVVGLEQHVAELGVGDPLLGTLQPGPHRLLGHHLVDGEVLADVAQELDEAELTRASRRCRATGPATAPALSAEVDEALELRPDAGRGWRRSSSSVSSGRSSVLPPGSPMPRAAPGQGDGPVAGQLQAAQHAQLQEVPTWRLSAVGSKPM